MSQHIEKWQGKNNQTQGLFRGGGGKGEREAPLQEPWGPQLYGWTLFLNFRCGYKSICCVYVFFFVCLTKLTTTTTKSLFVGYTTIIIYHCLNCSVYFKCLVIRQDGGQSGGNVSKDAKQWMCELWVWALWSRHGRDQFPLCHLVLSPWRAGCRRLFQEALWTSLMAFICYESYSLLGPQGEFSLPSLVIPELLCSLALRDCQRTEFHISLKRRLRLKNGVRGSLERANLVRGFGSGLGLPISWLLVNQVDALSTCGCLG